MSSAAGKAPSRSRGIVGGKSPKKRLTVAQRQKKRRQQKIIAGIVFAILAFLIWFGAQPLRGNIDYGVCRTYAETQSVNPWTMRILSYENYGPAWRIFYSFTGEYGEQKSNVIDCIFTNDAAGNRILRDVKINRVAPPKEQLDRYNMSIPGVIAGRPNLVIPYPLEESDIIGLRNEFRD